MCRTVEKLCQVSRNESKIEGIIVICKSLGMDFANTVKQVMAQIPSMSESETEQQVKSYWN